MCKAPELQSNEMVVQIHKCLLYLCLYVSDGLLLSMMSFVMNGSFYLPLSLFSALMTITLCVFNRLALAIDLLPLYVSVSSHSVAHNVSLLLLFMCSRSNAHSSMPDFKNRYYWYQCKMVHSLEGKCLLAMDSVAIAMKRLFFFCFCQYGGNTGENRVKSIIGRNIGNRLSSSNEQYIGRPKEPEWMRLCEFVLEVILLLFWAALLSMTPSLYWYFIIFNATLFSFGIIFYSICIQLVL